MSRLQIIAVSAPYYPSHKIGGSRVLVSKVPFSLQNACRHAAGQARSGNLAWGNSNWATEDGLLASVLMYDYADELDSLWNQIKIERPNLLLIGSMSLSMPGAVMIAEKAKELLGDDIFVVLGGKHPSETMYLEKGSQNVIHNPASPLLLMNKGKTSNCFDLIVSGDGENLITAIGELIHKHGPQGVTPHLEKIGKCPGRWVIGWQENDKMKTCSSVGIPINYSQMPIPAKLFGFSGRFDVFSETMRTAHVYSDISRGCMYDCSFCTERQTINGKPRVPGSAIKLARQLEVVHQKGLEYGESVSAFCEDSILLMGVEKELDALYKILIKKDWVVPFGGQITVPLFLRDSVRAKLAKLQEVGLEYLFVGLETPNEEVAQTMSKNIGKGANWITQNEQAVKLASDMSLKYGAAVLFGLGESQKDRMGLLNDLLHWQEIYSGNPCTVSLNWATQHPLLNVGTADYLDWGTKHDSDYLPYFQRLFGEASEVYPAMDLPSLIELDEIERIYRRLNLDQ